MSDETNGHRHEGDHSHGDRHVHNDVHGRSLLNRVAPFLHTHTHADAASDPVLETSERGIRALKISFAALMATALFQVLIFVMSGSVALLADTIHNFSDALTSIPLWLAFIVGRRAADRRYTYGYGRIEDLAGVLIVVLMLLSAVLVAYQSITRLVNPAPFSHLPWVITAACIGFIGNELVAMYRVRVGREIGSAALIADGHHARADGLTSLAVLFGALGVAAGYPVADPIVGLVITVAILIAVWGASVSVWHRLTDAVDPAVVENLENAAATVAGVGAPHDLRVRWLGHKLVTELHVTVDEDLPTHQSHMLAEEVEAAMRRAQPRLSQVIVHVDPCGHGAPGAIAEAAHQN